MTGNLNKIILLSAFLLSFLRNFLLSFRVSRDHCKWSFVLITFPYIKAGMYLSTESDLQVKRCSCLLCLLRSFLCVVCSYPFFTCLFACLYPELKTKRCELFCLINGTFSTLPIPYPTMLLWGSGTRFNRVTLTCSILSLVHLKKWRTKEDVDFKTAHENEWWVFLRSSVWRVKTLRAYHLLYFQSLSHISEPRW